MSPDIIFRYSQTTCNITKKCEEISNKNILWTTIFCMFLCYGPVFIISLYLLLAINRNKSLKINSHKSWYKYFDFEAKAKNCTHILRSHNRILPMHQHTKWKSALGFET